MIRRQNQVLKKLVKLLNSQNVNYCSRCEFIRLRIQYGTEISSEIEYHSYKRFQALLGFPRGAFFLWNVLYNMLMGMNLFISHRVGREISIFVDNFNSLGVLVWIRVSTRN